MKQIFVFVIAIFFVFGCTNKTNQKNQQQETTISADSVNDEDCFFWWEKASLSDKEKQEKIDSINATAEQVKQLVKEGIFRNE